MIKLNLPAGSFRVKSTEKGRAIFDPVRKKYVILTPEEWVRQHVVQWLLSRKRIPINLMNVEKQITVGGRLKRYDIVVYQRGGGIFLLVECKAPTVQIEQQTFDQIATYNMLLKGKMMMVTNGLDHFFCRMDHDSRSYKFLRDIPEYSL